MAGEGGRDLELCVKLCDLRRVTTFFPATNIDPKGPSAIYSHFPVFQDTFDSSYSEMKQSTAYTQIQFFISSHILKE